MLGKGKKNKPTSMSQRDESGDDYEEGFPDNTSGNDDFDDQAGDQDEWSDHQEGDDAFADADSPQRTAKNGGLSKLLPYLAVGVLAAGGIGYFYLNYMMPKPQQATSEIIAAIPEDAQPQDQAAAPVVAEISGMTEQATEIQPAAENVSGMAQPESAIDTATGTAQDASSPSDMAAAPEQMAQPQEAMLQPVDTAVEAQNQQLQAAPQQNNPVGAQIGQLEPIATTDTSSQTASASVAPVETPETTGQSATEPAQNDTLSDLSARLDVLEHQIEDLTKSVDKLASATSAPSGVDPMLAQTVSDLQGQVKALQDKLTTRQAATRSTSTEPQDKLTPAPSSQTASAPATRRVTWVLRAAQNGEAWVSRTASGDLRSVSVGDTLPGIGRITAIRTGRNGWEVVGTQGTIKQ